MKYTSAIHKLAAIAVLLVWAAMIGAMTVNRDFWGGALPYILLVSIATIVGTALLSRYWIRRKSAPSYGSIFVFPSICVFLFFFCFFFFGAWSNNDWEVFTLSFWEQAKGGLTGLLVPLGVFWFICLFPAASVVIYFQNPRTHIDYERTPEIRSLSEND